MVPALDLESQEVATGQPAIVLYEYFDLHFNFQLCLYFLYWWKEVTMLVTNKRDPKQTRQSPEDA